MYRVKIFGAGSIGNHLANASRTLGWQVVVCDRDPAALERMKSQIYPGRYGKWDDTIQLCLNDNAPRGSFDLIHIGTPPDWHLSLAMQALQESPRALLIEKPLCPPDLKGAQELFDAARNSKTKVYVGYDHVLGMAALKTEELIKANVIGEIKTIDVDFREHWGGIFAAHPWLSGPEDSYLGFTARGGGASGEHSHALHFWQHLAHLCGGGAVSEVTANIRLVENGKARYDDLFLLTLQTEKGIVGRVVQDVVTQPPRKRARVQGSTGALEWVCGYSPEGDAVLHLKPGAPEEVYLFKKKRPDDFLQELRHLQQQLENPALSSPISLERGLDSMLVIAAAHESASKKCSTRVRCGQNYATNAVSPA